MFGSRAAAGAPTWIVAFLGNPGADYERTRHNAGWMASEAVYKKHGIKINRVKFQAVTGVGELGGQKVFLMKPQTFMNLSGDSVAPAAAFYKIPRERIIVVHDDMAIPLGSLRVKRGGSDGGHNGLKSLIARLGGQEFPRVKIGVGEPPRQDWDRVDWVIGRLSPDELAAITDAAARAADAVEEIISSGVDSAMNIYNRTAGDTK